MPIVTDNSFTYGRSGISARVLLTEVQTFLQQLNSAIDNSAHLQKHLLREKQQSVELRANLTMKRWHPKLFFHIFLQVKKPADLYNLAVTRRFLYRGKFFFARPSLCPMGRTCCKHVCFLESQEAMGEHHTEER